MSGVGLLRERRFGPFFAAQFTGAFNDNVLKQAVIALFTLTLSTAEAERVSQLATALFILPYFFLSATAGQLAEKMEKGRLIRMTKVLELAIVVLASLGFILGSLGLLLVALTLLGAQSTLFGPVKYAILPQVLEERELVPGNAIVEAGTYIAILAGEIAGAQLVAIEHRGIYLVSALLITTSAIGYAVATRIPAVPSRVPDLRLSWNIFAETWRAIGFAREVRSVWLSILGASWFWLFAALVMIQLPTFVTEILGGGPSAFTLCLVVFSIGIGVGSMACEALSRGRIELGLVPLGAIGLTVFAVDLYFASRGHTAVGRGLGWSAILSDLRHARMLIDFAGIGVAGGIYSVPLFAMMQSRSDPTKRSRIIAANNIVGSVFIVLAAAVASVCREVLGLSIPSVFLVAALLNVLVSAYVFSVVPEFVLRFLMGIAMNTMYRLETVGLEHVPEKGAALVVCNHVSFVDGLILAAAIPRPVRFVMYYKIYEMPGIHWLFRWGKAIPIAGRSEDAATMEAAFAEVRRALDDGELVGIFPEGMITYTGEMNAFRPGVERILEANPVPVVPTALRGLWGSWFSRSEGPAMAKRPKRFWSRIELHAAAPIPAEDASAERLHENVSALRGDAR